VIEALPKERPLLLALDLDGTLIETLRPIRSAVIDAVRAAAALGVRSTIVTGRMYVATVPYIRALAVDGPVICYQGAVLAEATDGRFLSERPLANKISLRAYEAAKAEGYHVQFYADDRFYVEERNRYSDLYARISFTQPIVVRSLAEAFAGRDSTKVNIITDPERVPACTELMRRVCGDEAYVTRSNPEYVELLDPNVDKGRALREAAQLDGISLDRVLAIGDSYNDLPLLRAAGFAVAMGSAPPELKSEADAVVGDVEHDGVAEAIRRFVLEID
jgi:Cof subfamily protein (haloacid dehalogenase superfamily)